MMPTKICSIDEQVGNVLDKALPSGIRFYTSAILSNKGIQGLKEQH